MFMKRKRDLKYDYIFMHILIRYVLKFYFKKKEMSSTLKPIQDTNTEKNKKKNYFSKLV